MFALGICIIYFCILLFFFCFYQFSVKSRFHLLRFKVVIYGCFHLNYVQIILLNVQSSPHFVSLETLISSSIRHFVFCLRHLTFLFDIFPPESDKKSFLLEELKKSRDQFWRKS